MSCRMYPLQRFHDSSSSEEDERGSLRALDSNEESRVGLQDEREYVFPPRLIDHICLDSSVADYSETSDEDFSDGSQYASVPERGRRHENLETHSGSVGHSCHSSLETCNARTKQQQLMNSGLKIFNGGARAIDDISFRKSGAALSNSGDFFCDELVAGYLREASMASSVATIRDADEGKQRAPLLQSTPISVAKSGCISTCGRSQNTIRRSVGQSNSTAKNFDRSIELSVGGGPTSRKFDENVGINCSGSHGNKNVNERNVRLRDAFHSQAIEELEGSFGDEIEVGRVECTGDRSGGFVATQGQTIQQFGANLFPLVAYLLQFCEYMSPVEMDNFIKSITNHIEQQHPTESLVLPSTSLLSRMDGGPYPLSRMDGGPSSNNSPPQSNVTSRRKENCRGGSGDELRNINFRRGSDVTNESEEWEEFEMSFCKPHGFSTVRLERMIDQGTKAISSSSLPGVETSAEEPFDPGVAVRPNSLPSLQRMNSRSSSSSPPDQTSSSSSYRPLPSRDRVPLIGEPTSAGREEFVDPGLKVDGWRSHGGRRSHKVKRRSQKVARAMEKVISFVEKLAEGDSWGLQPVCCHGDEVQDVTLCPEEEEDDDENETSCNRVVVQDFCGNKLEALSVVSYKFVEVDHGMDSSEEVRSEGTIFVRSLDDNIEAGCWSRKESIEADVQKWETGDDMTNSNSNSNNNNNNNNNNNKDEDSTPRVEKSNISSNFDACNEPRGYQSLTSNQKQDKVATTRGRDKVLDDDWSKGLLQINGQNLLNERAYGGWQQLMTQVDSSTKEYLLPLSSSKLDQRSEFAAKHLCPDNPINNPRSSDHPNCKSIDRDGSFADDASDSGCLESDCKKTNRCTQTSFQSHCDQQGFKLQADAKGRHRHHFGGAFTPELSVPPSPVTPPPATLFMIPEKLEPRTTEYVTRPSPMSWFVASSDHLSTSKSNFKKSQEGQIAIKPPAIIQRRTESLVRRKLQLPVQLPPPSSSSSSSPPRLNTNRTSSIPQLKQRPHLASKNKTNSTGSSQKKFPAASKKVEVKDFKEERAGGERLNRSEVKAVVVREYGVGYNNLPRKVLLKPHT